VSVKYIPNGSTKIVVGGVTYQNVNGKTAILPADKIGKDELERLLARKFVKKLDLDETGTPTGKKETKRDKLIAKAEELGIVIEDSMADAEIDIKIKDAAARGKLLSRAKELGIEVNDEMTSDEIRKLIKEAKA
jgi:hypothetical protein